MRRHLLRILGLGTVLGVAFSAEHPAIAQSFPGAGGASAVWLPLTRGGTNVGDATNDSGTTDHRDIVGNAANPAAYVASDATYLYFRVRVNAQPRPSGNFVNDRGWGCALDTDGVLTTLEFIASVDGNGNTDDVRYYWNSGAGGNSPNSAETLLATFPIGTHAQSSTAGSNFSSNADYFVDWAIPWTTIRTPGNGAPNVVAGTPLRFLCGTTTDNGEADDINFDQASSQAQGSVTLSGSWSDAYVCNSGGNTSCTSFVDTDGDSVPDSVETALGTSPTDPDSDDDGLRDDVELSAGTPGAYSAVDTDGSGPIDALDPDSDNDCTPDAAETAATFRNPALPNANPNDACGGATPFCNRTNGVCSACNGDAGSGATVACPSASAPICNASGPFAGRCTQCSAADSSRCTGATPTCELATGTCVGCTGDFGSATPRACPTALLPACQTSGPLIGTCTACRPGVANACLPETPACSTTTGSCVACNGNNGSGATAPCPTTALRACNLAGSLAGRCTACTPSFADACTGATPACDVASGACAPCNGDRGSGASRACPTTANPYCNANGTCGRCTQSDQCGAGHTGPTCDVPSGACVDVDTDGDGLQDAVEILLGTDPTKRDSDDDGIEDRIEVTPVGGGPPAPVDTDGDGVIDALDPDSDGDGVADSVEARAPDGGPALVDSDGDGRPDWRDTDDDNDLVSTKDEVDLATAAGVSDDVDGDGLVNWLDSDANGNGALDINDGTGDRDGDGIPSFLDLEDNPPAPDGGFVPTPPAPPGTVPPAPPPPAPPAPTSSATPPGGVLEGTGLFCSTGRAPASAPVLVLLAAAALATATRRRR